MPRRAQESSSIVHGALMALGLGVVGVVIYTSAALGRRILRDLE